MTPLLQVRDLTLGYDRHPAVHHLNITVNSGALLAVVGPNGAGKSTLLRAISGRLKPLSGAIERGRLRPHEIAYLPQAAEIDRSFPIKVYDLVAMGLWHRVGLFGGVGRAERHRIAAAIDAVGLTGFEQRPIGHLSGGQMQRVLFARLLLQDAQLVVLDEPFNAVDSRTTADLVELVQRWHREQRTVIAALHDFEMVRAHFPEVLLLAREPVAWGSAERVLTSDNLARARQMCEAFDDAANACVRHEAAA